MTLGHIPVQIVNLLVVDLAHSRDVLFSKCIIAVSEARESLRHTVAEDMDPKQL